MARKPADPAPAAGEAAAPAKPKPKRKRTAAKKRTDRKANKKRRAAKQFTAPDGTRLAEPYRGKGVLGKGFNKAYLRKVLREPGEGQGGPRYDLTEKGVEKIDEVLSAGDGLAKVCEVLGCGPHHLRSLRLRDKAVAALIEDARTFGVKYRLSNLAAAEPSDRDSAAALTAQVTAATKYAAATLPHIYGARAIDGNPKNPGDVSGNGGGWAVVPQKQIAPAKAMLVERLAHARNTREPVTLEGEARLVLPTKR